MAYHFSMLELGFRTHDFGRKFKDATDIGKTARSYRENSCLHFAPYKVLDDAPKPYNNEWAAKVCEDLSKETVRVAILGCYINPVHPDPDKLEIELGKFENGIDIAKALGNPIVATETGSLDTRNVRCEETWTDKNFDRFLRIVERLLTRAERQKVTIAIEAVADKNTVDNPERMFKVMETFKSPYLRCLFDAVNIMPIKGLDDYYTWYDNAVSMLAPYICAMHLKDYKWGENLARYPFATGPVKDGTVPIGEGLFPWKTVFGIYKKYNVCNVPMTLENFNPETLKESLEFIERTYEEA